ncbi:MAG: hypothetical protein K9L62_10570 [Vallitaleaceae bacterium]|nr:hypothetical protein [Vallitaleaceae bacterium]
MRIIINIVFISLLLLPVSSYSSDLSSNTLYDNIITSLKSEEEGWFFGGGDLNYANPSDVKKLKRLSFPEHDDRTLLTISYSLFYNGGYVIMKKPIEQHVPDKYEGQLLDQIKVMVMKKLISEGVKVEENTCTPIKEIKKSTKKKEKVELKKTL